MKKLVKICLPVFLFGSLNFVSTSCGGKKGNEVTTDTVTTRTIVETVTASGKVQPEIEVKISSDVSGEIVDLFVKEGDSVVQGQLLLIVNPDLYISEFDRMQAVLNNSKSSVATANARLEQSKSQLLQAELNYNRNKTLFDKKAISKSEWESIETNYYVAQSDVRASEEAVLAAEYNVKSTQASLKAANDNLKRTQIFAPMSGIVSMLGVEKGERIVGTAQMAGTEMLRIADLANMEVNVEVNENDIVKVDLGDTTLVEVDAYLGRKFKGIVTQIANSAMSSAASISTDEVTNFEVKIRILRESYEDLLVGKPSNYSPFRPGMSATVEIQTAIEANALAVPIQAVTARGEQTEKSDAVDEDGGKTETKEETGEIKEYVFVVEDDKVKLVQVTTGVQDSRYIQILSGLSAGQVIVEGPYKMVSETLKDESKVKVTSKEDMY